MEVREFAWDVSLPSDFCLPLLDGLLSTIETGRGICVLGGCVYDCTAFADVQEHRARRRRNSRSTRSSSAYAHIGRGECEWVQGPVGSKWRFEAVARQTSNHQVWQ